MKITRARVFLVIGGLAALSAAWAFKLAVDRGVLAPADQGNSRGYTLIEPGLYMGGSVEAPPRDARAVLNLSQARDDYRAEVERWQPIPDSAPAPSLDWLRSQVEFIDAQRRAGRTVFVHCDAGISRSGLMSAAYLMWKNHWSCEQALGYIRKSRPIVEPNPTFMELLAQWERTAH